MTGGLPGTQAAARALNDRAAAIAARRVERRKALLAQIYGDALPDAAAVQEPRGVVLSGRRLKARLLADAALRWPAGLLARGRA